MEEPNVAQIVIPATPTDMKLALAMSILSAGVGAVSAIFYGRQGYEIIKTMTK